MKTALKHEHVLCSADALDLKKTFECGQCFRWESCGDGVYRGVAGGHPLTIRQADGLIACDAPYEDLPFWENYFDLAVDYGAASAHFTEPAYLKACADFGSGIRILRQDPWEALVSFIVSQCNNIPRIKKIIATLCKHFGDDLSSGSFAFPSAERLALLDIQALAPLKSGYRACYILSAACAVAEARLDLAALAHLPSEESFARVRSLYGVGEKVANCFMLYGLHRMERFPIDVWMRRALDRHFPKNFDPSALGPFAGLAQQYIFYYARLNERSDSLACT